MTSMSVMIYDVSSFNFKTNPEPKACQVKMRVLLYGLVALQIILHIRSATRIGHRGALQSCPVLVDVDKRPLVVLPAVDDPGDDSDQEDDAKGGDAVVHVGGSNGDLGGEDEEDGGEDGPGNADHAADPSDGGAELVGSVLGEHVSTTAEVDEGRDGISDTCWILAICTKILE